MTPVEATVMFVALLGVFTTVVGTLRVLRLSWLLSLETRVYHRFFPSLGEKAPTTLPARVVSFIVFSWYQVSTWRVLLMTLKSGWLVGSATMFGRGNKALLEQGKHEVDGMYILAYSILLGKKEEEAASSLQEDYIFDFCIMVKHVLGDKEAVRVNKILQRTYPPPHEGSTTGEGRTDGTGPGGRPL